MKAKDLKNSILQMAVEGKLVPQDPTDEPATVLLERIREEKHKLIAEGKAKFPKGGESIIYIASDGSPYEKRVDAKGRVLSEKCIVDEVPFEELPEGWAWTRLESALVNRDSERIPVSVADRERLAKIYDYYGASGIIDKVDDYLFDKPLLLIGEDGANLLMRSKPIAFLARGKYWVNNHAHVLDGINEQYLKYVALFINSISLAPYVTGTAQPKMNQAKMGSIIISIPPEVEQGKILAKVDELMPLVEEYGQFENAREKLDTELPGRLRKSVLQMAVQGKLVPQDPADEPASELLGRIREQRRKLDAEGKAKLPKGGESVIFCGSDGRRYEKRMDVKGRESEPVCIEDEIPFEIPESWEWTRLENLADISGGNTPKKEQLKPVGNIPYFKVANMNSIGNEREMVNAKLYVDDSYTGKTFPAGTIIYPKNGGAVLTNKRRMLVKESVVDLNTGSCTPYLEDCLNYLRLFFETIDFREFYKGTAVPTVNGSLVKELLVPLPSLTEQSRIVKRLEILQNIIV